MIRILFALGFMLALTSCKDDGQPAVVTAPAGTAPTTAAAGWDIQYSPGMPAHPAADGGGWGFDFPGTGGSVHYVTTLASIVPQRGITANIKVATSGNAIWNYKLEPNNTCDKAASTRLFMQRQGDDLIVPEGSPKQYYRWWAINAAFDLADGETALSASFSTPGQWTSVYGKRDDTDAEAAAGFQDTVHNLARVGFTFGGGCFYGHGVQILQGSARFTMTAFELR